MSRTHRMLGAAISSLFGLAVAGTAAAQATWDRSAEAISIISKPGDPAGTYRITGAWAVKASNVSTLALNTKITILRNGTAIASETVPVSATAGVLGDCVACPSPNTCVCAEPSGPCACNALWMTSSAPVAVPLGPGDVITMIVSNASGGVPDTNLGNDIISRTFNGNPSLWNRRLLSAELTPSPCPGAPNSFDLSFFAAVDFAQLNGPIPFDGVLTLIVNGAVAMEVDFCADEPWLTTGTGCGTSGGGCDTTACGSGSCAGANVDLNCMLVEMMGGAYEACVCSSGGLCYKVPGLSLPGVTESSSVKLVFSGNRATALPEIPLLDGDNSIAVDVHTVVIPCPADINHDGTVDAADLAEVLAGWGPCPG